jgi:glycosyltransferase involved in cell wall biosynthesis
MKILIPALHYYPVVGGLETWTRQIAQRLSQKAEVFVVTGKVKAQPNREERGGLKITRTSLFALSNLSHSPIAYSLSLLPFIFFKSLVLIKKEKINILHCQGFLSSLMGSCLSKLTGVPYIVTVQKMESKGALKRIVYRRATVCIGASQVIGQYFKEIGCRNIEVIPNGIDLQKFSSLQPKPHNDFVVMTIARLEKVKGVEYLIRAFAKLIETEPQLGELVIIGDGSERKNLENLAESLKLKERVKFLGEIPNERMPEYLAMADCFVLPSLKEGFGIVVLEAQAAGVPVIASKVGGILDLIEDQKNGLLVESGNPEQIAAALAKVYSGWRPSVIDLKKYNWQDIADKVYQVYQKSI